MLFSIFSYLFLFLLIPKYFFLPTAYVISRSKSVTNINFDVTNEKQQNNNHDKQLINNNKLTCSVVLMKSNLDEKIVLNSWVYCIH